MARGNVLAGFVTAPILIAAWSPQYLCGGGRLHQKLAKSTSQEEEVVVLLSLSGDGGKRIPATGGWRQLQHKARRRQKRCCCFFLRESEQGPCSFLCSCFSNSSQGEKMGKQGQFLFPPHTHSECKYGKYSVPASSNCPLLSSWRQGRGSGGR